MKAWQGDHHFGHGVFLRLHWTTHHDVVRGRTIDNLYGKMKLYFGMRQIDFFYHSMYFLYG